jgi:hypothetical protein
MKATIFSIVILSLTYLSPITSGQTPNTWTQKANFGGTAREAAVGFSIGNKGYIGTGEDQNSNVCRDFWAYDPSTNTWTQKANFGGIARERAVGFSIGAKGYIGTGQGASNALNDFWEYDTTSNSWTQKANFGGGVRMDAVGFSIGSKGYVGTGESIAADENDFWEYDPSTNIWTRKTNFGGAARYWAVGFSIGNKGYIGTGRDYYYNLYNDFWAYNPTTDTWTQSANYPGVPRDIAAGFGIGPKGYIGTGFDNFNTYNDFWEYDTLTNTWTQKANFGGTARCWAVGFSIYNKGFIGTGVTNQNIGLNDFWQYTPTCSAPPSPTNMTPSANQNICTGHSTVLSASGPGTLGWYSAATGGIWLGAGTNITTPVLTSNTTYYVQDSTCMASASRTAIPVIVNPLPVPTITGNTNMCVNSGYYNYATEVGMQNYSWSVSSGGIVDYGSSTNQITVSWIVAGSQTVSVTYTTPNGCNPANPTFNNITVNPLPGQAGNISGNSTVCTGTNGVAYSIVAIPNSTTYVWSLLPGASIASGAGTNSITVNFADNATSGDIIVYGNNICGDGPVSPDFPVTVNDIPPTPVITNTGDTLQSNAPAGNQWYFQGTMITGATGQDYVATLQGYYWDIVTLDGCPSDTSNHKMIIVTGMANHPVFGVNIFPVPNEGKFDISITAQVDEKYTISIYNNLGVVVYKEENLNVNGSIIKRIDLGSIPSGVYTVRVTNSFESIVKKVIID